MMTLSMLFLNFAIGFIGACFMARYAFYFGLVDLPSDRSSHDTPTPRGGGIGILLAVGLTGLIADVPLLVWLPAVGLSVVSLSDDKLDLPPRVRLLLQFFAAFTVLLTVDWVGISWFYSVVLFVFFAIFIVGTANFYNFMDGINGIAGVTGFVSFSLVALFAYLVHLPNWQILFPAGIAAACIGFLPWNMPNAKVFMGDVGSVLLGFAYSSLVCLLAYNVSSFICFITFLFLFYADALTTLFIRWKNGEKLSDAHRRHLYQVLCNELGIAHWKVSCGYGLLQILIGVLMLLAYWQGIHWQFLVFGISGIIFLVVNTVVRATARRVTTGE